MSDIINTLPVDEEPLGVDEQQILSQILASNRTGFHGFMTDIKMPIIYGALFLAMSLPFVDPIVSLIPYAKSSKMSLLVTKTFLFIVFGFIINNLELLFSD
jgi:hypothetical protein